LIPVAAVTAAVFGVMAINRAACRSPGAIDGHTFRDAAGQCSLRDRACAERLMTFVSAGEGYLIIPKITCP
jgi:hypothetical protein